MGILDKLFATPEKRAMYNVTESAAATDANSAFSLDSLLNTEAITEQKVMKIPTAKACVDIISNTIAQMPVYLYKQKSDGSIERVDDKRVKLLNHEANDYLNSYNLKKNMTKDYILHGGAYVSIIEAGNTILELHPLQAQSLTINKKIQNGYRTVGAEIVLSASENGALNSVTKKQIKFKPYELLIALQESHDGLSGKGVIAHGSEIFKQALSEMEYTSNLYERGALPLGLLKTDARLNETQSNALREAWSKLYSGIKNSAKTVVLQEGMTYQALSMNPNEIQMIDTKKNTNSEICKLFGVPESIVNSVVGKQYVSIEQNNMAFLKNTLAPIIFSLESAFDRAMLLETEKDNGYFFRFDTTELTRATDKDTVATLIQAVQGGLLTLNEARARYDLPALDDDILKLSTGDVLLNPETGEVKVPNVEGGTETDNAEANTNDDETQAIDETNDTKGDVQSNDEAKQTAGNSTD